VTGTGRRRGEPAAEEGYRTEQFSFVDDADATDVIDWLAFSETRVERREERRRRNRNRLVAALVVLALLVMGGGGYLAWRWLGGGEGDALAGAPAAVLFQVRGPKGEAVASAVLRGGPGARGASVLVVPGNLRLQAVGHEPTALTDALTELGPSQSRDALSEMLGVQLDGSWILEEVAFASLVDQVGGIRTSVDVDVPRRGQEAVKAGNQRLDGSAALAYGTYRARSEPDRVPLARQQRVLLGMLEAMPASQFDATRLLNNLGVLPDPALSNERLGSVLSGMAADVDGGRVEQAALPVRGDGIVDARAAGPVVRRLLGGSGTRAQDAGPPRVMVQDGTAGRPGGEDPQQAVGVRLLGAGYRYINGGRADERKRNTVIQVSDAARDGRQAGEQVALTLGLPMSAVAVVKADEIAADILVIVGDDFRP
jgi:hypothetical protein